MSFFNENQWMYGVLAAVALVILLICILLYCKLCGRWSHRARGGYLPINSTNNKDDELSLSMRWHRESHDRNDAARDTAYMLAQYYLREESRYWIRTEVLPAPGCRPEKNWFLVQNWQSSEQQMMYTLPKPDSNHNWPSGRWDKPVGRLLLEALRTAHQNHPCLLKITELDFLITHERIVCMSPYMSKGSVKDSMYRCKPLSGYAEKYSRRGESLQLPAIRAIISQVIRAAQQISRATGISCGRLGCIHSGNILLTNGGRNSEPHVLLAGWESVFLGISPTLIVRKQISHRTLRDQKNALDTICIGHLVYELASGRTLEGREPTPGELLNIPQRSQTAVVQFLNYIFTENQQIPTLAELAEHPFVKVKLNHVEKWRPLELPLSSSTRTLLTRVVAAIESGNNSTTTTTKASKRRGSSAVGHTKETSTIPPPPPPPAAPPPPSSASPVNTNERAALLTDIRQGTKLRKAVTNDRSAPKV